MRAIHVQAVWLCCALGCGGSEATTPPPDRYPSHAQQATRAPAEDDFQVEGLTGTLSATDVRMALEQRNPDFLQCFFARWRDLRVLGGRIEMGFRVATDGSVLWVYPRASTLGDRPTERCVLDVAARTRFPRPNGGEAEFSSPFEVDPPEGVRPAFAWTTPNLEDPLADLHDALEDCDIEEHDARFDITAYVGQSGEVLAAGAAISNRDLSAHLNCVTDAVRSLTMPVPEEYPAKITFEVRASSE